MLDDVLGGEGVDGCTLGWELEVNHKVDAIVGLESRLNIFAAVEVLDAGHDGGSARRGCSVEVPKTTGSDTYGREGEMGLERLYERCESSRSGRAKEKES